jgi:transposase
LHVGLDLSRSRLDYNALDERGHCVAVDAAPPDADGLAALARRFAGAQVRAAIESMNAARVKGLAPLASKTDRIDARVLAELSWRELVPQRKPSVDIEAVTSTGPAFGDDA